MLGVLWTVTEAFYRHLPHGTDREGTQKRVTNLLHNIDMSTILFFLGILMAVACLEEVGVLTALGEGLNVVFSGNHYMVTGIIGVLSSIVDNVPLVAGCMGMYPVAPTGDMAVDGVSGSCWPIVPVWEAQCSSSALPLVWWSWVWRRLPSVGT